MGQQQLLLITLGAIVLGISISVGITMFYANEIESNKQAIVEDMNGIAAYCYQYRIRPRFLGGGQNSYVGCSLPRKMISTDNGSYSLSGATATSITISGANPAYPDRTVSNSIDSDGKWGPTWAFGVDFE